MYHIIHEEFHFVKQSCPMNEKKQPQTKNTEQIAEVIRIVTVPPIITAALLTVILLFSTNFGFRLIDYHVLSGCLSIIPICVYPLCRAVPSLKEKGRNGERKLAFVFNLIGYGVCFVFGAFSSNKNITLLATTYFISVIILTVLNKLLHIRASGHAASSFMPCVFSVIYVGAAAFSSFVILFIGSVWSSLYLKRHRLTDIIAGVLSAAVSFGIAFIIKIIF